MNALVSFGLCDLTDEELLTRVDKAVDEMYQTGKIPDRRIPARPNDDFDLLVGELVHRYYQLIKSKEV